MIVISIIIIIHIKQKLLIIKLLKQVVKGRPEKTYLLNQKKLFLKKFSKIIVQDLMKQT